MRSFRRCVAPVLCAIVLGGLAGCASRPDTRYYVLTPLPPAEGPRDASSGHSPQVGLRRVSLPEYLDRPQIVTRVGENMLHLAEFDQWGSPLREDFTRVLAADLSSLLPADRVAVFPWMKDSLIDYEVTVEVTRLEGSLGGTCSLLAHWAIFGNGGKESIATGNSSHSEPVGDSYATLVAAQSRLVAALGRDIATAIKAAPR